MVSTTFSTAAVACRRSEPNFSVSTSMSSALFMQNLRSQWPSLDRLEDTVNPRTADFQEPRAISGVAGEHSGNPLAPLGRWPEGSITGLKGRDFGPVRPYLQPAECAASSPAGPPRRTRYRRVSAA